MRPVDPIAPSEPSTVKQSYPDAVESNEMSQGSSTCSSGSNGFRVRGVSEINDAEDPDVDSSGMKRKHCTEGLVNEESSCKKTKNFKAISNDADTSNSPGTGKELHQGDEENQDSNTETPSFTASDRVRYLNASVANASISSVAEIETREENGESKSDDKNPSSTALNSDTLELNNDDEPCSSSTGVLVHVKTEPVVTDNSKVDVGTSMTSTVDIKPTLNVKKEEATSSSRESCKYGIRCYRRNPMHRIEEAHPGDHDYKRPNFPMPPAGTPDCPFGDACYRRNPSHFQQYTHPPETDFEHNWKMRLRQRRQQNQNNSINNDATSDFGSDMDDYDLEDPFIDDDDLDQDYAPSDDNDEEYDECDKAEE